MRAVISAESRQGTIPSLSVVQTLPSRRRNGGTCALFAAETQAATEQSFDKPLKAYRNFIKRPTQAAR